MWDSQYSQSHYRRRDLPILRLHGIWQKTNSWQKLKTSGSLLLQPGRDVSILGWNLLPPDSLNRSFSLQLLLLLVGFSGDLNSEDFPPVPRTWKWTIIGKISYLAWTNGASMCFGCFTWQEFWGNFGICVRVERLGGVDCIYMSFLPICQSEAWRGNKSRKCCKQFSFQTCELKIEVFILKHVN